MLKPAYPYYLAGRPIQANQDLPITDKYSGHVVTHVALADTDVIEAGISAAHQAQEAMAAFPPYRRREVLEHCVRRFSERHEELARVLCIEAGKPIRDARGEVDRLIDTFRIAAEEAVRIHGEVLNLEISARAQGYRGLYKRVPLGPCGLIAPFNFPLNLAAHKIAPAIAAGCSFVLKPASRTPIGALLIGEVLAETDLPPGAFSILPASRAAADLLITDPRLKLLSFTGSSEAGWALKARAGRKKVVLELGGNAACIVDADQGEVLDRVVERIVFGAFYQSGQSCISVQRILVHADLYEALRTRLVAAIQTLKAGDPRQEDTFIGPMISEEAARTLHERIIAAQTAGARLLCGGERNGAMLAPTLLENVPESSPLSAREAFGPVAMLAAFDDFDTALAQANASAYGLQAGVFTHDLHHALRAWDRLDVGGVVIGDVPSFRVDNMPYGGVKDSGIGREGVRYAIEDMTQMRLLVLRDRS